MSTIATLKKASFQKIGKIPVVVLPLDAWEAIARQLEELEMINSTAFRNRIAKARLEKKFYTASEAKRMLKR